VNIITMWLVIFCFTEEDNWKHQLEACPCYEKWQVCAGLSTNSEDTAPGKGKTGYNCQQHTSPEVNELHAVFIFSRYWWL